MTDTTTIEPAPDSTAAMESALSADHWRFDLPTQVAMTKDGSQATIDGNGNLLVCMTRASTATDNILSIPVGMLALVIAHAPKPVRKTIVEEIRVRADAIRECYLALAAELKALQHARVCVSREEVWWWQDDGTDDVATIACPIVILPEHLRGIIERGHDAVAEARQEAARTLRDIADDLMGPQSTMRRVAAQLAEPRRYVACTECGRDEHRERSSFCGDCGTRLPDRPAPPDDSASAPLADVQPSSVPGNPVNSQPDPTCAHGVSFADECPTCPNETAADRLQKIADAAPAIEDEHGALDLVGPPKDESMLTEDPSDPEVADALTTDDGYDTATGDDPEADDEPDPDKSDEAHPYNPDDPDDVPF